MKLSEIKKEARISLKGKWGKAICILLVYFIFIFVLSLIEKTFAQITSIYLLIELAVIAISIPLSFGLIVSFMKLKRNEEVKYLDFIKYGFTNFTKSWGIWLNTLLKIWLPIVCIILIAILLSFSITLNIINGNYILSLIVFVLYIATIIYSLSKTLLYAVAYNIRYDNPELSSKACVLKSEALMIGNRKSYFLLELSFIGWAILSVFTFGIGYLWLMPYMQVALVCFYDKLAKIE